MEHRWIAVVLFVIGLLLTVAFVLTQVDAA